VTDGEFPVKSIKTARFGRLSFKEDSIITFPDGIIGHETLRRFAIVGIEEYFPFFIFASLDRSGLCFPIISPHPLFQDYRPSLPASAIDALGGKGDSHLLYCMVRFSGLPRTTEIDLSNPLVINMASMVGRQITLEGSRYGSRTPIDLSEVISRLHSQLVIDRDVIPPSR